MKMYNKLFRNNEKEWKERTDFDNYMKGNVVSDLLIKQVMSLSDVNDNILEIGCGCGRNLRMLQDKGYVNLFGVEINEKASVIARSNCKATIFNDNITNLNRLGFPVGFFKVVFSYGVLCFLNRFNDVAFTYLCDLSNGYIITFENECSSSNHFNILKKIKGNGFDNIFCEVYDFDGEKLVVSDKASEKVLVNRVFSRNGGGIDKLLAVHNDG